MKLVKPLFIGAYIAMIAYMPFACTQAWDKETKIEIEQNRKWAEEARMAQLENPNP